MELSDSEQGGYDSPNGGVDEEYSDVPRSSLVSVPVGLGPTLCLLHFVLHSKTPRPPK